jgi:hypothetical protein
MNVRRLAALDLHGARGTSLRRRLVLAEFAMAVAGSLAIGGWILTAASGIGGRVVGAYVLGAGLNYVPLLAYAITLSRPGALAAELAGVDIGQELRRYSVLQAWLFVPLALIVALTWPDRGTGHN